MEKEKISETRSVDVSSEPTPSSEGSTKLKGKPWLKIVLFSILGLVVAAGLVFVGYKFGQRQVQPTAQPVLTLTATPTLMATPTFELTPASDPTMDWKTYISKRYNFFIKYPNGWQKESFVDHTGHETVYFKREDEPHDPYKYNPYNINVGFISNEEIQQPFKEWVENYLKLYDRWQFGEMTQKRINSHEALVVETPPLSSSKGSFVFIKTRSGVAKFFTVATSEESDAFRVFNLMLSTFKFLE